jgi:capsular polysaccharide biosynthesis protein
LNILRRWIWLLVLAGIGSGAVAYVITKQQPPTYEAKARLIVGPGIDSLNPDLNELRTAEQLMRIYADLATTRPVLESVVSDLQLPLSSDALKKMIDVTTNTDTQILGVQVRGGDSAQVITIANKLADKILSLSPAGIGMTNAQLKADVQVQIEELKNTIEQNKETLKQLEARQVVVSDIEEKRLLFDQLNQVRTRQTDAQRILATLYESYQSSNTNQIKIIELAVNAEEVDSTLLLTTVMATIAGLILTLTLVLVFEFFDDSIRTVADLAYTAGIPILASIAKHKRLQGIGRERFVVHALPDSRAAEGYRVLSSKLLLSRFQHEVNNALPIHQNYVALTAEGVAPSPESTLRSVVISGTVGPNRSPRYFGRCLFTSTQHSSFVRYS